jgi:hypothetical protein
VGHLARWLGHGGEPLRGDAGDEAAFLGVVGQLSGLGGESAVAELGLPVVRGDPQGEGGVVVTPMGAARFIDQQGRAAGEGRADGVGEPAERLAL